MAERVQAFRCIGCGKVEAPQPCIGICEDRIVEFVDSGEYDAAVADAAAARQQAARLSAVVRRLAFTTPRNDEWERSYRALQAQARAAVEPGVEAVER